MRSTVPSILLRSACAAFVIVACGDKDLPAGDMTPNPTSQDSIPTHRYSGPGSFYRAVIDDAGGFTIEISASSTTAVAMTIAGQYERLPTGFLELVVAEVQSSVDGAPSVGDRAYALELPGFALFFNPTGSSEVIPMLVMDACPTADFAANWIMIRGEEGRDASHNDREWFGGFSYVDGTTPQASIGDRYNLSDLSPLLDAPATIDVPGCADGHLPVFEAGRLTANMWLTNGGAIVETFVADGTRQTLVAMRPQAVTAADVAGQYAALMVGQTVEPATVLLNADGSGSATPLMDPSTNQTASTSMTLNLAANASLGTGWLSGNLQSSSNVACSALAGSGQTNRTVLVCIGQDPSNPTQPLSLLMASRVLAQ